MSDDRWWIETYHVTAPQVRRYLVRQLPRDEIDDALADVYLTAWVRRDRLADCPMTIAWLMTVAHNVTRHRHRTRTRTRPQRLAATLSPLGTDPTADQVIDRHMAIEATAALTTLAPPDRTIVTLRILDERDFRTIADTIGLHPATARQRYRRALQRLRRATARNRASRRRS